MLDLIIGIGAAWGLYVYATIAVAYYWIDQRAHPWGLTKRQCVSGFVLVVAMWGTLLASLALVTHAKHSTVVIYLGGVVGFIVAGAFMFLWAWAVLDESPARVVRAALWLPFLVSDMLAVVVMCACSVASTIFKYLVRGPVALGEGLADVVCGRIYGSHAEVRRTRNAWARGARTPDHYQRT